MSTRIRNEIAASNPYYMSKHEYLMTRHFALQYNDWKKCRGEIESRIRYGFNVCGGRNETISQPVEIAVENAEKYIFRMNLVEQAAKIAGEDIWEIVLIGVTTECNYDYLRLMKGIPCCKDVYYKMYRKFFWILYQELSSYLQGA